MSACPKPEKRRSAAILRAAEGEDCYIRLFGVCQGRHGVVWCHSNELADGKGKATKAHDDRGAPGCAACHRVVDGHAPRPEWLSQADVLRAFRHAIDEAQGLLNRKGLL